MELFVGNSPGNGKTIRVAIIGIGGLGGYFGTRLVNCYQTGRSAVFAFIQRGKHLIEIQARGLKYRTRDHEYTVIPDIATDNPTGAGLFDLVLFCVKSYDLAAAAASIQGNLHRDSVVLSTLNGVDAGKRLKTALPGLRVLSGCIYLSARIEKPGLVRQIGGVGNFFFGSEEDKPEPFRLWESFLKKAGIKAELVSDIRYRLWEKYIFVCPFATLTALYDRTIGQIMEEESHREQLLVLIDEIRDLARADGLNLPVKITETILERAVMIPPETTTSLQLDFRSGKKTEIDIFTGYVVTKGRELGVSVPLHDELAGKLGEKSGPKG